MLNLDISHPLLRPSDLLSLVTAIHTATHTDEQDWLEWKRTLDLRKKADQFAIARTILGMANREPGIASDFAGGYGYLVVGVEPGNVDGVEPLDTAKLDDAVSIYTGREPVWSLHSVSFMDRVVLVFAIRPPGAGDPVFALAKTFRPDGGRPGDGADDGTIYVRRGTKTSVANSTDIAALTQRARDGSEVQRLLLQIERVREMDRRSEQSRLVAVDLMCAHYSRADGGVDVAARFTNDSSGPIRRCRIGVRDDAGWLWGPQLIGNIRPYRDALLNFRLKGYIPSPSLNAVIRFQDIHNEYWVAETLKPGVELDTRTTQEWIAQGEQWAGRNPPPDLLGFLSGSHAESNGLKEWQQALDREAPRDA